MAHPANENEAGTADLLGRYLRCADETTRRIEARNAAIAAVVDAVAAVDVAMKAEEEAQADYLRHAAGSLI